MSIVVCRLKHGLILELPTQPAAQDGADFASPTKVVLKSGVNENVPGALFEEWLQHHAGLPIVKRRDVFLVSDAVSDRQARNVQRLDRAQFPEMRSGAN